jgi:DNA-binding MarR family transcriptional regulator
MAGVAQRTNGRGKAQGTGHGNGRAAWLDDLEMRAWLGLLRSHAHLMAALDHELREEQNLTLPEYEVMAFLSEAPESRMRMSDLAEQARVSPSALTRRIDRLEREGFVERLRCPEDGRVTWASLTRAGLRRLTQAAPTHVRGVREHYLSHLSRSDLRALADSLERVAASIDEVPCPDR